MKISDIDPTRLDQLNAGEIETTNLTEGLAVDFGALLMAAFPAIAEAERDRVKAASGEGVTRRMALVGTILAQSLDDDALGALLTHPSDTVRGWLCFALAGRSPAELKTTLNSLRPLADDPHFGVREWAWLAVRSQIADNLTEALAILTGWTASPSANIRRFASEATRPRGVWCAHIGALKEDPSLALPLLLPLRSDPSRYVQDSVGNWLNDAAKSRADWVRTLCDSWSAESDSPATARITKRALRTLNKQAGKRKAPG